MFGKNWWDDGPKDYCEDEEDGNERGIVLDAETATRENDEAAKGALIGSPTEPLPPNE